ncbi:MAG: class I SAM-dependent methyltransferase [Bacteroidota bacterium]
MKDNFSDHSKAYAQFRPHYPDDLFVYLLSLVKEKSRAWDCGTGNGQIAGVLSAHFSDVYATDISSQQLEQAVQKPNLHYSVQPAEKTTFPDHEFNLVTVAQAIHWFRFEDFYAEVKRVLKPGGLFAVIGYGLVQTEPALQKIIDHFYTKIIGSYWDAERHYIDEGYQTIPFPFAEINTPIFEMAFHWNFEQLIGYLGTWSAVRHYRKQNNEDPVLLIKEQLADAWIDSASFSFPLFLRIGY